MNEKVNGWVSESGYVKVGENIADVIDKDSGVYTVLELRNDYFKQVKTFYIYNVCYCNIIYYHLIS